MAERGERRQEMPDEPDIPHNKALQLTDNPLRGLSAAELGRYAV